MRNWLRRLLLRWEQSLRTVKPRPVDQSNLIRDLSNTLRDMLVLRDYDRRDYVERCHELVEARQMAGTGPWLPESRRAYVDEPKTRLTESLPALIGVAESTNVGAQGSMGQLELDLQNVDWRREVNLSWLEFSRWGIQQIILISRLYYIKNPLIRRLIDVDAAYVMGKYFIAASEDESVNDAIQDFLKFNAVEFGHSAMVENQKRTNYDGNLFFIFFPDTQGTGICPVRQIDATEIQDLITNPEDVTEEWYYRRTWSIRLFLEAEGRTVTKSQEAWYPSVFAKQAADANNGFQKLEKINGYEVKWDSPVLHAKFGFAGRWTFGCPRVYPALDWAKADRRYLEACATLAASHAQIAMTISTKGGPQALAGVKQQLETTVGPTTQVFDTNPTANTASIFAAGPGTTLETFNTRGKGLNPDEHKQYAVMACNVIGVPPTWAGDMETSNLATATTLDRPTEAGFENKQESWRELLISILLYALTVQLRAAKGALREALEARKIDVKEVRLVEKPRIYMPNTGKTVYITEAQRKAPKKETDLEITVQFPPIREGDLPQLMGALVEAITLNGFEAGNGIDVKEGVKAALALVNSFSQTDIDVEEVIEKMYPEKQYQTLMDRTKIMQAEQEQALAPAPEPPKPGVDQPDIGTPPLAPAVRKAHGKKIDAAVGEAALRRLGWAHERIARILEARRGRKAA